MFKFFGKIICTIKGDHTTECHYPVNSYTGKKSKQCDVIACKYCSFFVMPKVSDHLLKKEAGKI